jgi:hypothetical protein
LGLDEIDYPAADAEVKAKWLARFPKPFFYS